MLHFCSLKIEKVIYTFFKSERGTGLNVQGKIEWVINFTLDSINTKMKGALHKPREQFWNILTTLSSYGIFGVFEEFPHSRMSDLSIHTIKNCNAYIGTTRVIILYLLRNISF